MSEKLNFFITRDENIYGIYEKKNLFIYCFYALALLTS